MAGNYIDDIDISGLDLARGRRQQGQRFSEAEPKSSDESASENIENQEAISEANTLEGQTTKCLIKLDIISGHDSSGTNKSRFGEAAK